MSFIIFVGCGNSAREITRRVGRRKRFNMWWSATPEDAKNYLFDPKNGYEVFTVISDNRRQLMSIIDGCRTRLEGSLIQNVYIQTTITNFDHMDTDVEIDRKIYT